MAKKPDMPPLPPLTQSISPVAATVTAPATSSVVPAALPPVAAPVGSQPKSPLADVPAYAKQPANGWETKTSAVEHLAPPPVLAKTTAPQDGWPTAHNAKTEQVAYVTKGVVTFDEDLPEPAPVLGTDKASLLKQKIAGVCGTKAKEVTVETKPNGDLDVYVKTASPSDNLSVTGKVLGMEEMASPNVHLHVIELAK
jgi:hypothetical protein